MMTTEVYQGTRRKKRFLWYVKRNWQLYVLLLPTIVYLFLFQYMPITGVQIAFRNFTARGGIWNSTWVGLKHFQKFFSSPQFWTLLENTMKISVYSLLWGFPIPILLAVMLNECKTIKLKKTVQMLTYAPHFISTVVLASMIHLFLDVDTGIINKIIELFGGTASNLIGKEKAFRTIYVVSGIWQSCGWSSIIYISALSGVDAELYEAAKIDGANRLQKVWYIDLPSILPTIVTLFILNCGNILNVGYEKVYLLQNSMNQSVSEVISTYVYKIGLLGGQFSYTTAIGLFNSVVNVIILLVVNRIAKKVNDVSLF